jgi:hypothetical protein
MKLEQIGEMMARGKKTNGCMVGLSTIQVPVPVPVQVQVPYRLESTSINT